MIKAWDFDVKTGPGFAITTGGYPARITARGYRGEFMSVAAVNTSAAVFSNAVGDVTCV